MMFCNHVQVAKHGTQKSGLFPVSTIVLPLIAKRHVGVPIGVLSKWVSGVCRYT